jgi:hypothetical protein
VRVVSFASKGDGLSDCPPLARSCRLRIPELPSRYAFTLIYGCCIAIGFIVPCRPLATANLFLTMIPLLWDWYLIYLAWSLYRKLKQQKRASALLFCSQAYCSLSIPGILAALPQFRAVVPHAVRIAAACDVWYHI